MPLYDFKCQSCNEVFEELVKSNSSPIIKCKKCDSDKVEKLLSTSNFKFNGSGFYITDYKNKT